MASYFWLTASMLRAYKSCPKKYWFEYVQMLKPSEKPEALAMGSSYHDCLEHIIRGEEFTPDTPVIGIMAEAWKKYIPFHEWDIESPEVMFEQKLKNSRLALKGKMDAVCRDGSIVEHKTTRNTLDDKYLANLAMDDQVSFYLLAQSMKLGRPITTVHYTAIQKPTIRQKASETEEDFLERLAGWYTEDKVKSFTVTRNERDLQEFYDEISELYKEIKHRKLFYRNPSHCNILGCQFASICQNYDPELMTGFVKKTSQNEELEVKF